MYWSDPTHVSTTGLYAPKDIGISRAPTFLNEGLIGHLYNIHCILQLYCCYLRIYEILFLPSKSFVFTFFSSAWNNFCVKRYFCVILWEFFFVIFCVLKFFCCDFVIVLFYNFFYCISTSKILCWLIFFVHCFGFFIFGQWLQMIHN